MTSNVKKVLKGYLRLTESERTELLQEIEKHRQATFSERTIIEKGISDAVSLGPLSSGACPCCGR